ncbi:CDP-glycerol glycerophosphotransferase [Lysobacter arvi]|uniref:CDP-glycerol glycerophosphotransferase n=1 Tax=Lysobacter arvi TaxID=3038776 RepID=A0ABU1CH50_9GAMM|nr:CDP-glycerol glycerophosphotransferase [Lysobacter arvi]MDR0184282.1 CDP-glycerol glycerophosphotransferase [Lysobacter arvi]
MPHRLVLLASEPYSLPILRPLAHEALVRGHEVAWVASDAMAARLAPDEPRIASRRALKAFAPQAVFATVNRIPPFFPGWQVQLFHGLNLHKRDPAQGQHRVQGLFDLYCTHGPATTGPMQAQAQERGDFVVVETGWPKLDPLFGDVSVESRALRAAAAGRPVAMFASTFNAPISCADDGLAEMSRLVARGDRYWLLTLHPMSPPERIRAYRALAGPNAVYLDAEHLIDMLHAADALVCDTTSVAEEMALLGKPVVTVRHRKPQPFMHDVSGPEGIDAALEGALIAPEARRESARAYADALHPSRDGRAAARVLDAVESLIDGSHRPQRRRNARPWRRFWRSWKAMRELLPG